MEFRQLEAFIAVATGLHFGRAAEKLGISQPTLSELVRRLEREMGTPLLARTTRRVTLTSAGAELLERAQAILDDVSSTRAAVRRVANGEAGVVRLGVIPAAQPVLIPHLVDAMCRHAPDVIVEVRRLWPAELLQGLADGSIDAAINCGDIADPSGVVGEVFCGERVMIALRTKHPLAERDCVAWVELAKERFGIPSPHLFAEWSTAQRRLLGDSGIAPPTVELETTDYAASGWSEQTDVDWIMTSAALRVGSNGVTALPVSPIGLFLYKLQWNPARAQTAAAARFVQLALTVEVPDGWFVQPGHLRFDGAEPPARRA